LLSIAEAQAEDGNAYQVNRNDRNIQLVQALLLLLMRATNMNTLTEKTAGREGILHSTTNERKRRGHCRFSVSIPQRLSSSKPGYHDQPIGSLTRKWDIRTSLFGGVKTLPSRLSVLFQKGETVSSGVYSEVTRKNRI
jgi:hypothetical protein